MGTDVTFVFRTLAMARWMLKVLSVILLAKHHYAVGASLFVVADLVNELECYLGERCEQVNE